MVCLIQWLRTVWRKEPKRPPSAFLKTFKFTTPCAPACPPEPSAFATRFCTSLNASWLRISLIITCSFPTSAALWPCVVDPGSAARVVDRGSAARVDNDRRRGVAEAGGARVVDDRGDAARVGAAAAFAFGFTIANVACCRQTTAGAETSSC